MGKFCGLVVRIGCFENIALVSIVCQNGVWVVLGGEALIKIMLQLKFCKKSAKKNFGESKLLKKGYQKMKKQY